jgi:hypothetical protein
MADQYVELLAETVTEAHAAAWESAPAGHRLGVYLDFLVRIGPDVGREDDPEERPVVVAECPGRGGRKALLDELACWPSRE